MSRVTILDLGMGNLRSVARAFERAGASVSVENNPSAIAGAERLVVPGQGHFRDAAAALRNGFGDALREYLKQERPYLGLCLGMQILFDDSEEAPGGEGLGVLPGHVRRLSAATLKVPHMGWNTIRSRVAWLRDDHYFFVHSYACVPAIASDIAATTDYGTEIVAAVVRDNVSATQFHPEKSGIAGENALRAWLTL